MIKIAAFDIDGTLFDERAKIYPEPNVAALRALRKNGILVAIATGRPPVTASVLNAAGIEFDYLVCSNGHLVMEGSGNILENVSFCPELAQEVWCYCDEHSIGLLWKYPDCTYVYRNHEEFEKIFSKNTKVVKSGNKVIYDDHRIHFIRGANGGCLACSREEQEEFNRVFSGRCIAVDINGRSSDLLLWGVNKRTGLDALLRHLGIEAAECIAFGDNQNDIEMLRYAGVGVAMGNGTPELKEISDYICGAVDEDGIGDALRHFQLI